MVFILKVSCCGGFAVQLWIQPLYIIGLSFFYNCNLYRRLPFIHFNLIAFPGAMNSVSVEITSHRQLSLEWNYHHFNS